MIWTEEAVRKATDEPYESISLHYAPKETGWGARVENGRAAVLTNLSMSGELRRFDVVELVIPDYCDCGRMAAGKVIFRVFHHAAFLRYGKRMREKGKTSLWEKIHKALRAAGIEFEGFVLGIAMLNYKEGQDPEAVLKAAGVTNFTLEPIGDAEA